MSEDQLKAAIIDLAELNGWMVYSIRRSDQARIQGRKGTGKGWPDLFLLHPQRGVCMAVELKSKDGKATPSQRRWLEAFEACRSKPVPAIWRPEQWTNGYIESVLRWRPPVYAPSNAD